MDSSTFCCLVVFRTTQTEENQLERRKRRFSVPFDWRDIPCWSIPETYPRTPHLLLCPSCDDVIIGRNRVSHQSAGWLALRVRKQKESSVWFRTGSPSRTCPNCTCSHHQLRSVLRLTSTKTSSTLSMSTTRYKNRGQYDVMPNKFIHLHTFPHLSTSISSNHDDHNMWNSLLDLTVHFYSGPLVRGFFQDE